MYDDEYRKEDATFELCVPIRRKVKVEGIAVKELPDQQCLALVHRGPYPELGRSYEKLIRFAKEHGYKLTLPSREVYLKWPGIIFKGNPKDYLTELQIPFERQSDAT